MAKIESQDFLKLFDKFIRNSASGRRLQKNGKRLQTGTVQNYKYLFKLLSDFSERKNFPLRLKSTIRFNSREFLREKKYWKTFYSSFCYYLYHDLNCFDNYVGSNMKMLRTFFNYLNADLGLQVGNFHKDFYVRKEETPIIVLEQEQLNFLIFDKKFEASLNDQLKKTKDIFVIGCTVALRVSDLMQLRSQNLEVIGESHYLKVHSKKTHTQTRIKLPKYAIEIINRWRRKQKTMLPQISLSNFNKNIRTLMEVAGWTQSCLKSRSKQGLFMAEYRNNETKELYRFCDLVSSHTMRRTAITAMLDNGVPEYVARKISGHSANSKEFYRYVALSQSFIDQEVEKNFEQIEQKKLSKGQEVS